MSDLKSKRSVVLTGNILRSAKTGEILEIFTHEELRDMEYDTICKIVDNKVNQLSNSKKKELADLMLEEARKDVDEGFINDMIEVYGSELDALIVLLYLESNSAIDVFNNFKG